jgi:hypothetical protein
MPLFRHDPRDLRNSQRHEVHYLAQIDCGDGSALVNCIICDISAGGAKLTVGNHNVPDEFTLVLRRNCRVIRRSDGQLGVQFAQPRTEPSPTPRRALDRVV